MIISDLFQETYLALLINKARSGLTMLGIIIGIGSVIAMVSIGQGASGTIESNIQALGSNLIIVMPGMQRNFGYGASSGRGNARSLTIDDADAIQNEVSFVKTVTKDVSGRYQVTAKGTNTNTQVIGTTSSYADVRNVQVESGNFISDQNVSGLSKVAVLGPTTRNDLFGENADPIGQTIKIKGIEFKVIGVTKSKGGSGFNDQDDMIYIPVSVAQKFLSGNQYLTTISVQATDQKSMTTVQEEITSLLLTRHKISDVANADFSIMNQSDIIQSASSITNTLTM